MKRFPFLVSLAFLLLLVPIGIVSAASAESVTTTPERTGGSIYFETSPSGATIWLDNVKIGTSPITFFSEKTGTLDVRVQKKGFEDYLGNVTVSDNERVIFRALLTPLPSDTAPQATLAEVITTATTNQRPAVTVPTPWPTSTPESPVSSAVVIGAIAISIGCIVVRRCLR